MSDEFHQIFVPGRAGMITDVGIDTIGVMLGVAVGKTVEKIERFLRSNEDEEHNDTYKKDRR